LYRIATFLPVADSDKYSDFAGSPADADDPLERLNTMRTRMAAAVGTGESADGLITARFTAADGLASLDLDPRALRAPSADLAEYVRLAVNNAYDDYRAAIQQIGADGFGGSDPEARDLVDNPQAALGQLAKLGDDFAGRLQGLAREMGIQQHRVREAMARFRPVEE
jgi:DNA-binding protein YbaB